MPKPHINTESLHATVLPPSGRQSALQPFLTTSLDDHFENVNDEADAAARLALFAETAHTVPAYSAFLKEHGVDPAKILVPRDMAGLPAQTRENYISRHSLPDLCRSGRLELCDMMAVSSGSTGKPGFWPRTLADEAHTAWRFEQVFHDSFRAHERTTLAVVSFALGTWVGGMYTAACCRHLAAKGYRVTVVTPGNNREEIFRVVQELAPCFNQTVLLGYPPFLKDVIDTGIADRGIHWPDYNIRLVMAGEVFSEEWRTLVLERVGSRNACFDSASLYGTADAGVLGCETPISICIRRYFSHHPEAAREMFGEYRLPTLVQYDPRSRYFEVEDNRLLFTGDNGIPLIRYNILDTGGVVGFEEMLSFLSRKGFDARDVLKKEAACAGRSEGDVRPLPFVYVFGRSNFAVSYFGANIYPENIAVGLEQDDIKGWVTGKFVLEVIEDEAHNSRLSVTIELAPGVDADDDKRTLAVASIEVHLTRLNSEFANYTPSHYRTPMVSLKPAGDHEYFPNGVKHRYSR